MTTNIERAGLVARAVEIESVNLKSAVLETRLDPLELPASFDLSQGYRASYSILTERPDHIYVTVELFFHAGEVPEPDDESAEPLVELEAAYTLVYQLKQARLFPEDALKHFAELNGAYNVWPYWRELVQTVMGRVGLAAVIVPVFRPPSRVIRSDEQAELSLEERKGGSS